MAITGSFMVHSGSNFWEITVITAVFKVLDCCLSPYKSDGGGDVIF